jgi:hypothetical protein
MKVTFETRSATSVEQLTRDLDVLAETYSIRDRSYHESAAAHMTEFDALEWITLCSQLEVLREQKAEPASSREHLPNVVPSRLRGIYGRLDRCDTLDPWVNTVESQSKLAA